MLTKIILVEARDMQSGGGGAESKLANKINKKPHTSKKHY